MGRRRHAPPPQDPTIRAGLLLVDPAQRTGTFQGLDRREVYRDGRVFVTLEGGEEDPVGVEMGFGEWLRSVGG